MKVFRIPEKYFQVHTSGEVLSKITSDADIAGRIGADLVTGIAIYVINIAVATIVLVKLSIYLALIALAFMVINFLALRMFRGRLNESSLREREAYSRFMEALKEGVDGRRELKLYGALEFLKRRFRRVADDLVAKSAELAKWEAGSFQAEAYLFGLSQLVTLGIGVLLARIGLVGLGTVIAFYSYVPTLFRPAERLVNLWALAQRAKPAARRRSSP